MFKNLLQTNFNDLQNFATDGRADMTKPLAAKILELVNSIALPVETERLSGYVTIELVEYAAGHATIEVTFKLEYDEEYTETHGANKKPLRKPRNRVRTNRFDKKTRFELEMFPLNPHQAVYLGLDNRWGDRYTTQWALAEDLAELTKAPAGLFGSFLEARQSA